MILKKITALILLIFTLIMGCQTKGSVPVGQDENPNDGDLPARINPDIITAFQNVSLVTMEDATVLSGRTVIVRGGKIAEIGSSSEIAIPADAEIINGEDRFLMPGLSDMHVHLIPESDVINDLFLFIANGVTTIRVMWGNTQYLDWRQRIENGDILGPTIFCASPGMDGPPSYWPTPPISTPEQGREAVASYAQSGFDFVKVYNKLSPTVFAAITEEARKHDMPIIGHIPGAIGLFAAIDAGQSCIEHLTGYAQVVTSNGSWGSSFQEGQARSTALQTRNSGVWNCPTQIVIERTRADIASVTASEGWRFLSPGMKSWLENPLTQPPSAISSTFLNNRERMIKILADEGADLILGTDTGVQYVLPGYSTHEELQSMVNAGLSHYDALRMSTKNAARFVQGEADFGSIAIGKRADLVLLADDPLTDVKNAEKPLGVMVRGNWFSNVELQRILEENAAGYGD